MSKIGKTDIGQGKQALALGGLGVVGYSNASGAVTYTATTVTPTSSPSWTVSTTSNFGSTNVWTGYWVVAGGGTNTTPLVAGVITSNSATALTIDFWRNPASPFVTASTPSANAPFIIVSAQAACAYMGITTGSVAVTDTSLASEETTNGLGRAAATFAHTFSSSSANNTYTLTNTYTYTGSSSKVLNAIGIFDASSGGVPLFTTALNATATVNANGDSVTVTDTVTM